MAGLPTILVELDDGTGTFPYNITSRFRLKDGYKITRGRVDELTDADAGTLEIPLKNNDGGFTPGSTIIASPSPVKDDRRIRVKLTANATTFTRCVDYIDNIPTAWPGGKTLSIAQVHASDVQSKAARRKLRSAVEEEMMADLPAALYTLGEPDTASTAGDTSGSQQPVLTQAGSGAAVVFGADGLTTTPYTAAQFAGGKYLTAQLAFGSTPTQLSVGVFFKTTGTSQTIMKFRGTPYSFGIDSVGRPVLTDGTFHTETFPPYNDGQWHFALLSLTATDATMYIEGGSFGLSNTVTLSANMSVEIGGASSPQSDVPAPFTGSLSTVVVSSTLNGAGPRPAQYRLAGTTGFAGESGTARLTRLAGYGSIPIGTLDTSLTNIPAAADLNGRYLWDAISDVGEAEMGLVFINGAGQLTFHNRNRAILKTAPDVTIASTFLDPAASFMTDMQGIVNYFEASSSATGVTQVARNMTSEVTNGHGRYEGSKEYLVSTDAEALDRANWIVGNYGEPQTRAGQLVIDLMTMTAADQAAMLAVEPNTWIRITGLPANTPGGTTGDFLVEGFEESLSTEAWTMTLNVVSMSLFNAWILGDTTYGVLGSTTKLYV